MKKLFIAICFVTSIAACKSQTNSTSTNRQDTSDQGDKPEREKKVTKRAYGITKANSYSDLFFDSASLVKFLAENNLSDTLIRRMTSFYNSRNYQYAWFSSGGLTEQARGFWNLHSYQTTYGNNSYLKDAGLQKTMQDLTTEEKLSVSPGNKSILNTELKLTQHFIMYSLNSIDEGYIKRKEMERFIPQKKEDIMKLADSIITKKHKDNKYYDDVNESYKSLKQQLKVYYEIEKSGGVPVITAKASQLKKGGSSTEILKLKNILYKLGDLPTADSTMLFTDAVTEAVKRFQVRHGYTPTGGVTDQLIKDLNVPAIKRVQQIIINLGRMQWMINEPKGQLVLVNIPEFILHVKDGKEKVFDMNVVVGKEGHNTMIFTGNLSQVVFSPYWNVPPSIVKKELLPAMARNANYLENQNMEITGNEGGLPVIRQKPGAKNSLGRVKFLFPNSFNIYMHDTQAKSLFKQDKRAYSHGCIRLSDPVKMANYVLKDNSEWTPESIDAAMNSSTEKFVRIKKTIPVLITYYTAWVDDNNLLHFADDIYKHDSEVANKMFTNPR